MEKDANITALKNILVYLSLLQIGLSSRCERYNTEIIVSDELKRLETFSRRAKFAANNALKINDKSGVALKEVDRKLYGLLSDRLTDITIKIRRAKDPNDSYSLNKEDFYALCHEQDAITELLTEMKKEE